MPLFVRKSDGEGVFIEPAAHRSNKLNAEQVVEVRQAGWLRLQEAGLSLREIAAVAEKSVRTIRDGIALAIQNRAIRAILADPDAERDARIDAEMAEALPPAHV